MFFLAATLGAPESSANHLATEPPSIGHNVY